MSETNSLLRELMELAWRVAPCQAPAQPAIWRYDPKHTKRGHAYLMSAGGGGVATTGRGYTAMLRGETGDLYWQRIPNEKNNNDERKA